MVQATTEAIGPDGKPANQILSLPSSTLRAYALYKKQAHSKLVALLALSTDGIEKWKSFPTQVKYKIKAETLARLHAYTCKGYENYGYQRSTSQVRISAHAHTLNMKR